MEKMILSLTMAILAACGLCRSTQLDHCRSKLGFTPGRRRPYLGERAFQEQGVPDPSAEVWLVIADKSGNFYVEPGPLSVKP